MENRACPSSARLESEGLQATLGQLAIEGLKDLRELKEPPALKVFKAFKESEEFKALKVSTVSTEAKAMLALLSQGRRRTHWGKQHSHGSDWMDGTYRRCSACH